MSPKNVIINFKKTLILLKIMLQTLLFKDVFYFQNVGLGLKNT